MLLGVFKTFTGEIWSSTGLPERVHHTNWDCGWGFWGWMWYGANCQSWHNQFTATLTKETLKYNLISQRIENNPSCSWEDLKDKNGQERKFIRSCKTQYSVIRLIEVWYAYKNILIKLFYYFLYCNTIFLNFNKLFL